MGLRRLVSERLVVPLAVRVAQPVSWPRYEELLRLDDADGEELRKLQWRSLQSIVEHARKHVSYYAESFGQAGVRGEDLQSWDDLLQVPTINKRQIAANFPDRITAEGSDRETWRYVATSGTTDQLMVVTDAETRSRHEARGLYGERLRGTYDPGSLRVEIPPDACSLACAAAVARSKGRIGRVRAAVDCLVARGAKGAVRWLGGRVFRGIAFPWREMPSFGPTGTRVEPEILDSYLARIRRWRPAVLSGLPTYLRLLARRLETSGNEAPQIKSLLPEGALSTPSLKEELARVFGVGVHEVYGAHEFGGAASTCEQGDKLHVMMSECLVETVRGGEHAGPGELGEVIITTFANRTMPLIRYRPGDVGRLWDETCPCGRGTQLLTLEGRLQDTIVTSDGARTAQEIIDFFAAAPNVAFAQLVQRTETRCDLLVVEQERGRTNLADLGDAAGEFLGEGMLVRPRLVSTVKPEVSGKFRFVKSTSYERFHETAPSPRTHAAPAAIDGALHLQAERSC